MTVSFIHGHTLSIFEEPFVGMAASAQPQGSLSVKIGFARGGAYCKRSDSGTGHGMNTIMRMIGSTIARKKEIG